MFKTGKITNSNVIAIMKELSLYSSWYFLSNESCLYIRKKIWLIIIAFSLVAIWFTVNPNDINNPVKVKFAVYRNYNGEAARALFQVLNIAL